MTAEQKSWAVRFDAHNSDWLHEREWRIPVMPGNGGLAIYPADIVAMLGSDGLPNAAGLVPEFFPQWRLPTLWNTVHRFWWDQANQRFVTLHVPTAS